MNVTDGYYIGSEQDITDYYNARQATFLPIADGPYKMETFGSIYETLDAGVFATEKPHQEILEHFAPDKAVQIEEFRVQYVQGKLTHVQTVNLPQPEEEEDI